MPIIIISESSRTIFLVTKFLQAFLHSNLHISFTSLTFAECFFFLSFLFGKKRVGFSRWCLGSCLSVPPLFFSVGCELDPSSQGQRKELCGLQQLVALCPPWSLSSSSDATQFRPFDLKHTHTHSHTEQLCKLGRQVACLNALTTHAHSVKECPQTRRLKHGGERES